MKYLSVCSGIEAATVAWHELGWQPAGFAEIEKFPSAVLAHHYPTVPNYGDMTVLAGLTRASVIEAPEMLVGGTPCQAFSVAGLRNSLDDRRGQLTLSYVDLLNAMDEVRIKNGEQPTIALWENVPGVLNTKDNAFGCFLGALAGESSALQPSGGRWTNAGCVFGRKRTVAWRVLDAQYFGLAQRRKRVFVVASARDGIDPSEILFESEGVRRDTPPSRKTGQEVAGFIGEGTTGSGKSLFGTLAANCGQKLWLGNQEALTGDYHVFALAGNTIGRQPENGGNGTGFSEELGYTLTKTDVHAVAYSFDSLSSNSMKSLNPDSGCNAVEVSKTIDTNGLTPACSQGGMGVVSPVAFQMMARRLTPTECARLQGFPDDYLSQVSGASDSAMYKALGNSMAVSVMRFLGDRIARYGSCRQT